MFERWGRFVYRFRWATLVVSALLLGLSIAGVLTGGTLAGNGGFGADLAAGQTQKLINAEIHAQKANIGSGFILIFSSPTLNVTDPAFESDVEQAVAPLFGDLRVTAVNTPYSVPSAAQSSYMSRNQHEALVFVNLKDSSTIAQVYIGSVLAEIHPTALNVVATGNVPINHAFNKTLESDLQRAEYLALPITLLMLVVIFASVIAALLPLGVGVLAIVGGIGGTLLLARFTSVSQYAINIITLIGLAVAIDYSLFIVNRFRDELAAGKSREDAIAIALSNGLTFLPAILAVLGGRVDWWPAWLKKRLPFLDRRRPSGSGAWHAMAVWVMRRPVVVLVPALAILLVAGTPFLQLRMANGDVDQLPPGNQAREGYDTLVRD